ncbi:pollen receptor-like kinase 4 [Magnolia sinica]|uniref:pollen receptor-like kinase 4 n=1 Tax=Magnolia sinica TaxID=86752 RepID=UPI0026589C4C|nr:pollen receptor-like kinase 4 [Magnolia sinica]
MARATHLALLTIFLHILTSPHAATAADSDVLLNFKKSIGNNAVLSSWTQGSSPCKPDGTANWLGVLCKNETVRGLQLQNMGLTGRIDIDVLMGLPNLRTLSFMNNSFGGLMPNVGKLNNLKSMFLSGNRFSGEIPKNAFEGMVMLKKVYLSRNGFSGPIPDSLVGLTRLIELGLEENQFTGTIPNFQQREWKSMNFSYNKLEGQIPVGLRKIDSSSFAGNKALCGEPMDTPCKKSKKLSMTLLIVLILIATTVVLAIVGTIFILVRQRHGRSRSSEIQSSNQKKVTSYGGDPPDYGSPDYSGHDDKKAGKDYGQGNLVFLREDREKFGLQDLLRASAQVLGNGSFGSAYKAVLLSGPAVVVKRFREMNGVGKEEFQDHMRRLGKLRHPNLLPLVAFYYKKEEKLLVSDHIANGNLVQLLHSNRSQGRRILDWPTRLKIIKGVARGMAHLYNELPNLTLPHGHLKSSNVLLDESYEPLIADYALAPMMNKDQAKQLMVAYQSPECVRYGHVTKQSDVWCLGILILEILTGKFPGNYNRQKGGGTDLASWVNSVVREEWTGEVFDGEMQGTKNGEGEMLKLLQVGLGCCERDVEKRWGLIQAVERIEELKERENEEYSSFGSEGEMYSSRDEFSFSMNV